MSFFSRFSPPISWSKHYQVQLPLAFNGAISFSAVSSFRDCSYAYRSCDLPKTLWFKNVKQILRRSMTFLVTLYCLTIAYDRAGFTYKLLRNHVQKHYVFFLQGVRTHPTHLVCLRHWSTPTHVVARPTLKINCLGLHSWTGMRASVTYIRSLVA